MRPVPIRNLRPQLAAILGALSSSPLHALHAHHIAPPSAHVPPVEPIYPRPRPQRRARCLHRCLPLNHALGTRRPRHAPPRCLPASAPRARWRWMSTSRRPARCRDCAACGSSPTSHNTLPYLATPSRSTRTSTSRYARGAPDASVDAPNPFLMKRALIEMQELESECLKPGPSEKLAQIGLALLKHVSSHKGLTYAAHTFLHFFF